MLSAAVEYVGPKVGLRDLCSQLVKAPSRMPANSFSLRHGSSLSFSLLFCFLISFQTILSAGHLVRDAAIFSRVFFFIFIRRPCHCSVAIETDRRVEGSIS